MRMRKKRGRWNERMENWSEIEIVEEEVRMRRERKEERMSEKRGEMMKSRQKGGERER